MSDYHIYAKSKPLRAEKGLGKNTVELPLGLLQAVLMTGHLEGFWLIAFVGYLGVIEDSVLSKGSDPSC